MVETLIYNMDLLPTLWPPFRDHIREVLRDSRYQVRYTAVQGLDRVISAVLSTIYSPDTSTKLTDEEGAPEQAGMPPRPPRQASDSSSL